MIVDVRTYNIVPRKMKTYLALFEEFALPILRRHLGDPLGYFLVEHGPLHQVVHFWGYENLADLEKRRAVRDADAASGVRACRWTAVRAAQAELHRWLRQLLPRLAPGDVDPAALLAALAEMPEPPHLLGSGR